jgi:hypothetical protein
MVDPHSDTQYTCEILDGGDEPIVNIYIYIIHYPNNQSNFI